MAGVGVAPGSGRYSPVPGPPPSLKPGGVHMVLEQEADGQLVVKSLLRGGQLSRTVHPLDRLVSVQSRNVEQLPLSQVRELVAGVEGSAVSLGFMRGDSSGRYHQRFVTTVTRTSSELQDVQLSTYEDLLKLIRAGGPGQDGSEAVYQEILRHSWRDPGSTDGKAFCEVVDGIMNLKSSNPTRVIQRDDDLITRLQNELQVAEETANRLRQELATKDSGQVAGVCLLVNESPDLLADPSSRKMLQEQAVFDVAQGLGVEKSRVGMVGMHVEDSRSLAIDLHITPPTTEQEQNGRGVGSTRLAERMLQQSRDPRSPFKQTPTGQKTVKVHLEREQDFVYRLRKTVLLLQEELKTLQHTNADLRAETQRLREQLITAEQNLKVLKRENAQKDADIQDLNGTIASLRAQLRPAIDRFERAEDENAVLRRKMEQLERENRDLQAQHAGLMADRREAEAEISRLRALLNTAADQRMALENEVARLRGLQLEIDKLREQLANKDRELKAVIDDNTWLREEVENVRREKHVAQEQRDALRMDCERYQREVSQLGRELADLRAQLARIPLVEEENRKLAKALGEAQDAQNKLRIENDRVKDMVNDLSVKNHQLQEEIDRLKKLLSEIKPEDPTLRETIARLERLIEDLRLRLKNCQTELDTATVENGALKTEVARRREDYETLAQQHRSVVKEVEDLRSRLKQSEEEKRMFETKYLQAQAQISPLEQQLRQQYNEFQQVKAGLQSQISQLQVENQSLKTTITQLEADNNRMRAEVDRLQAESMRLREIIRSYEDQQRRLAEEIETLKERLLKYSEVHSLDARSNHEKDTLVRSQQDEINRLRSQLVDAASTPPSGAQAGGGGYRPAPSGAPGGGGYRPEPISQQANTSNGDAAHSQSEQPKNAKPHSRGWFGR